MQKKIIQHIEKILGHIDVQDSPGAVKKPVHEIFDLIDELTSLNIQPLTTTCQHTRSALLNTLYKEFQFLEDAFKKKANKSKRYDAEFQNTIKQINDDLLPLLN